MATTITFPTDDTARVACRFEVSKGEPGVYQVLDTKTGKAEWVRILKVGNLSVRAWRESYGGMPELNLHKYLVRRSGAVWGCECKARGRCIHQTAVEGAMALYRHSLDCQALRIAAERGVKCD
jgi:hypothetical protein